MPNLVINNRAVEVAEGTSILQAARDLGIDIPTLCHWDGVRPMNSCMLCVVREAKSGQLVPSCSTMAREGMEIETDSSEVCTARKEVLELIVSEHLGDCEAPCSHTCPASMNIPAMMRQIYMGDLDAAAFTVVNGLVFPWTLGHVCPAPCQNPCRRKQYDSTMQIRELHKVVAEKALVDNPELLECLPDTGKRVAIIGAGLAGMAAAWVLRKQGHACTVYEKEAMAGGKLRSLPEKELPPAVLDTEIAWVTRLGIDFVYETEMTAASLESIQASNDAVIVACKGVAKPGGKVFEAAEHKLAVRCVGNGKTAALWVDRYIRSMEPNPKTTIFESKAGKLGKDELETMRTHNENQVVFVSSDIDGVLADARKEAGRCLHCDCRKRSSCNLRRYASEYGVEKRKYTTTEERVYQVIGRDGDVIFEPGKCIKCGLCVEIAKKHGEDIGLTFSGRGFDVKIKVPFGRPLDQGIKASAAECVAACPTAALSFRNREDAERCHTAAYRAG